MKKNYVSIQGSIAEMTDEKSGKINVPFAKGVNVEELIKGDKDPMFVTIEAISEGVSKNKRNYTKQIITDIARQVNKNKPDAYMGHLKDEDRMTKNPQAQTIWLGSVVKEVDGKVRLFVKGYVLPYASDFREYLKKSSASGKNVAVSVYGKAKQTWNKAIGAFNIENFVLESIDWARQGSEGITPDMNFSIAGEMENHVESREETISEMTVGELEVFNPGIVKAIQEKFRVGVISEMTESNENEMSVIQEMIGDKPVETISNMQKTIAETKIDATLRKEVKNTPSRKIIKKMIIMEMGENFSKQNTSDSLEKVLRSKEVTSIIKEMSTKREINSLADKKSSNKNSRRFTTIK